MLLSEPELPPQAYQSYQIFAPLSTHWRPATCREVECPQWERGWMTLVNETTDLGRKQAGYIRHRSGRHYTESRTPEGLTQFLFPPGQTCFAEHRKRLEREEIFVRRGGDFRGWVSDPYVHTRPEFWVEDFATNQAKLAEIVEAG